MSALATPNERIVIVGGGAGGAELAARLGRWSHHRSLEVILVDASPLHLWKPRLHELAAGLVGAGEEETSYLALARANKFRFRLGALVGIDPQKKTIQIGPVEDSDGNELLGPRSLSYTVLVLAFGSQVNDFAIEGVAQHCHMLDSGGQAAAFQRRFLEQAVRVADGSLDKLRVGIVGAGATGVELAAELHHAAHAIDKFAGLISPEQLQITLVDRGPRVLPNNDQATSDFATRILGKLGVRIRTNAGVERVTTEGLTLSGGEFVPCELKVWASGIIGRPIALNLNGLTVDKSRRLVCDDLLRCKGTTDIYAPGDCAVVLDPATQRPLPATAQIAHQQAAYLARVLTTDLHAESPARPFKYRPMGSLVSLGASPAAGEFPTPARRSLVFQGMTPKLVYTGLQFMHRAALIGWWQAGVLAVADRLYKITAPPVKLH